MASGGLSRSLTGPQFHNQLKGDGVASNVAMSLPMVDADKLQSRLYSYAPQQAPTNPQALRFNGTTNAQRKRIAWSHEKKLEPLVSLHNKHFIDEIYMLIFFKLNCFIQIAYKFSWIVSSLLLNNV